MGLDCDVGKEKVRKTTLLGIGGGVNMS